MNSLLITICLLAVVGLFTLGYYNLAYRKAERSVNKAINQQNQRLALILRAVRASIWTYDVRRDVFTFMDREGRPAQEVGSAELARRYSPGQFQLLDEKLRLLASGEVKKLTIDLRELEPDGRGERELVVAMSVMHEEAGRPTLIMGTRRDVTEERRKRAEAKELMLRYQSVFSTAMTDMVYFDETGTIKKMNQRSCDTFNCDSEELLAEKVTVGSLIGIKDLKLQDVDYFHATQVLNLPNETPNVKARRRHEKMYYELQLIPVFDEAHQLLGVYGSGRDVSEVVATYHKLRDGIARLAAANKQVQDYISNINYVLSVGGVRMADYDPDAHVLNILSEMDHVQYALTQARCLRLTSEQSKAEAVCMLETMDARKDRPLDADITTTITTRNKHKMIVHINFIPTRDASGHVTRYFGMCRDATEVKVTEDRLQRETVKAREIETIKNAFLKNMSYEIRTPLTAVVGFAELFDLPHQPADEQVFISEIKRNSSHLLALVNDILFLSRLDAHMIDINPQPVDFASVFEQQCRQGWEGFQREGVDYIVENPYARLVISIDVQNLGRVIQQIAANAAQHTWQGAVKARYNYLNNKLVVSIDDTGSGIPKEQQATIFERFVSNGSSGTGLGLPICQELTQQMGGTIDLKSTPGKGTVVWITIPCTISDMERK